MPVVNAVIIENVSNQIIRFLYTVAPNRGFTVSEGAPSNEFGEVQLAPKKKITLQSARVNLGQVSNFEAKGLIKVTHTRI